ncbi:L,D-transpeptidase [Hyphomicrobium sp.]|uniref:L,D-transpeptidase n=1 Tax=Hyphomicrobium sp. TaxID=82 RepID=UPI0025C2A2B4|nr:L,D-transpeptidase [Hyphomicrobium sp.]MCC7253924.1 L,D-transpeptidase [Hyphomicrobium sp.]
MAETRAESGASQDGVPTVTILNRAPEAADASAPPELKVSPRTPEPARVPAPAAAAAPPASEAKPLTRDAAEGTTKPPANTTEAPNQTAKAETEPVPLPEPTLAIDIDLTRQVMTVSEEGARLYTWPISSARYGYRTPTGTYRPTWMAKMWYSRQYDLAPMPHAIFFHKGVAIHATYATRQLGRPASHGCVRLAPRNAATLFKLVNTHGQERTEIVVRGKPDHSGAEVASRELRGERAPEQLRRGSPYYRYLPPSYYAPRGYATYAPRTYSAPHTRRRYYAVPQRPPRGLYSGYSYGYGF